MRNLYYLLKMARLSLPHKFIKYINILLLVFVGFFIFHSAYAEFDPNPKHSKWFTDSIVNDPLVKSTVEIKANRTYPVTVTNPTSGVKDTITKTQKTTVKLPARAANVGKTLMKGGMGGLITQALIGLGISAVSWVLDPDNNAVKYTENEVKQCKVTSSGFGYPNGSNITIAQSEALTGGTYIGLNSSGRPKFSTPDGVVTSGILSCTPQEVEKSVPIENVADKVIQYANQGQADAMQVMSDTALDMVEQGLLDYELEAAADDKVFDDNESDPLSPNGDNGTGTGSGTGSGTGAGGQDPTTDPETPTDPEKQPFEFPPFCDWATKVCDFIDWVQTEPIDPDESGDIPVEQPDPDMHVGILERLYIDMPAACPADPILEFMGAKIPFPMSIFCQFAEMMKPLILLFAYIKGLSIIGNGLT